MNFFKKKNYLALLLNQTISNSFPNSGLKLTCMGDPVDLNGSKSNININKNMVLILKIFLDDIYFLNIEIMTY
jgi:hypothetical protein